MIDYIEVKFTKNLYSSKSRKKNLKVVLELSTEQLR